MEKQRSCLICAKQALMLHPLSSTSPTTPASKLPLCDPEEHLAHGSQMQGLNSLFKTRADIHALAVLINWYEFPHGSLRHQLTVASEAGKVLGILGRPSFLPS